MKATLIKTTTTRDDDGKTTRDFVEINGMTLVHVTHPFGGCINIDGKKGVVYTRDNGKVYHGMFDLSGKEVELDLPANYLDLITEAVCAK